ncbi:MAG TPA: hypothetical protein ACFYD6_03655 [Candidatus Brocadiia bacterium]|nr:hypothetical protein [Candidatus Brocadiales bacterium]
MKLINRIFAPILFVTFLVPFTAFWQEEVLASSGTCDEVLDIDITVVGTGKNKQQALEDLDNKIADEANAMCYDPASCPGAECEAVSITTTTPKCKYSRRDRSWRCTAKIKRVECGCVEGDVHH